VARLSTNQSVEVMCVIVSSWDADQKVGQQPVQQPANRIK